MKEIVDFVKGSYDEFANHVTWPKWDTLQSATIAVAVFTLILSLFLYGVDTLFSDIINGLYRLLK
ncbi:preprotein translocase subunit SecE [Candidatus Ornithobacterium hominis]|uniref:preprotein translocase subunit SecE n=1 Tax=Candidatus Ornithobacterium hominis TaxID=2497989 RepID=UPI0024BC9D7F|nr:preprotein translocase subunit SecE [Candidatus Ornithobacterium hominis]CAI9428950.1 preprotein translocase subunit SecE [Candidatus Ornithobacterium hominis]